MTRGCARRRRRIRVRRLVAAGAAVLAWPGAAAGQGTVHAVSLSADFTAAPGMVELRMEYELDGVEPGASVPVSLLDFGSVRAEGFLLGTARTAATLPERNGAARSGAWAVETGPGGRAVLRVEYRVPSTGSDGSGRILSHLPVLVVELAPEAARPGLFRGRVRAPPDWVVTEGFPTGLAGGGEAGLYAVALAVVPSVVTLRGRADGRSAVGLPLILDMVALVVLLVTAAVGWRHMREPIL